MLATLALLAVLSIPSFVDLGVRALGEVLATTLAVMGVLFLQLLDRFENKSSWRYLVYSVVVITLSIAVKDILALFSLSVIVVGLGRSFLKIGKTKRTQLALIAVGGVGVAVPFVLRAFYGLCVRVLYPNLFNSFAEQVRTRSELLKKVVVFSPLANTRRAFSVLMTQYPVQSFALLFVVLFIASSVVAGKVFKRKMLSDLRDSLGVQLFLVGGTVWTMWFLFVSGPQANERHMFPGIVFATVGVVQVLLWAVQHTLRGQEKGVDVGSLGWVTLITVFVITGLGKGFSWYAERIASQKQAKNAQQAVVSWMQQNIPESEPISGWGWYVPWHVGFLGNRILAQVDLRTHDLKGLTGWLMLIPEMRMLRESDKRLQSLLEEQGELAYEQGGFEIFRIRPPASIKVQPPRITRLYPDRTRAGLGFNVQPDGSSAIAVVGENFTLRTFIVMNGHPLSTTFGGKTLVTAVVPNELFTVPGQSEVWVVTEGGPSNKLTFTVDP